MNKTNKYNHLNKLRNLLVEKQNQLVDIKHLIPSIWIDKNSVSNSIPINFPQFLVNKIDEIFQISNNLIFEENKKIRIYNSLVRLTTAFDYKQKSFNSPNDNTYFKNEGTFVKTIALLPYLKELGITHLYLLPITEIGVDGRKGQLGSPYSIKNHKKIDINLSEPLLQMSVEEQFKSLVEACHLIGIKVIVEMVFRTASKDNDLIFEHPDWFYWIKSHKSGNIFKPPKFENNDLIKIKQSVEAGNFKELIPPYPEYTELFADPPVKVLKEGNKVFGINLQNEVCEIPGAFADWPPDDTQPLWNDVTYLKLHKHPKFNYIAYNTVRMYDLELLKEEYRNIELWDYLCGIIPYFINEFDIDGVMIDMGHAMPRELLELIISKAKKIKENFLFLEENFVISNESLEKGFEIVVGYLPFDLHNLDKTINLINELNNPKLTVKYFGTPETHNTPRAFWRTKSKNFSVFSYLLSNLMNNAVSFVHNGFELLDKVPVNTGLDFEQSDLPQFPILPLFDYAELNWLSSEGNMLSEICEINSITDDNIISITSASKTEEDILKIEIKLNSSKATLFVNYSKNSNRIKISGNIEKLKKVIIQSDVIVTSEEIIFKSSFAFILFVLD